ncbi:class I SAM-dependent methyltransferase [Orrella marina]|uniref:Uncharacterized protein n=1 Tax=Orrella marina TaxID=2163011 RepID=A0A2R4XFJ1_9BURK|nr:class I SAM-dependent methyltransferase [Orrella marina]AWB32570.1 hypothetical protein DBV39_01270 [Orrella marina]
MTEQEDLPSDEPREEDVSEEVKDQAASETESEGYDEPDTDDSPEFRLQELSFEYARERASLAEQISQLQQENDRLQCHIRKLEQFGGHTWSGVSSPVTNDRYSQRYFFSPSPLESLATVKHRSQMNLEYCELDVSDLTSALVARTDISSLLVLGNVSDKKWLQDVAGRAEHARLHLFYSSRRKDVSEMLSVLGSVMNGHPQINLHRISEPSAFDSLVPALMRGVRSPVLVLLRPQFVSDTGIDWNSIARMISLLPDGSRVFSEKLVNESFKAELTRVTENSLIELAWLSPLSVILADDESEELALGDVSGEAEHVAFSDSDVSGELPAILASLSLPSSFGFAEEATSALSKLHERIKFKKYRQIVEIGAGITTLVIADALRQNSRGQAVSLGLSEGSLTQVRSLLREKNLDIWVELRSIDRMTPVEAASSLDTVATPGRWESTIDLEDPLYGLEGVDLVCVHMDSESDFGEKVEPLLREVSKRLSADAEIWLDGKVLPASSGGMASF